MFIKRHGRQPSAIGLSAFVAALTLLLAAADAGAQCGSCAVGGIGCDVSCTVDCPKWYLHWFEGPARIQFKRGCPRPIADPCGLPHYGYYETCWKKWPWPVDARHCDTPSAARRMPVSSDQREPDKKKLNDDEIAITSGNAVSEKKTTTTDAEEPVTHLPPALVPTSQSIGDEEPQTNTGASAPKQNSEDSAVSLLSKRTTAHETPLRPVERLRYVKHRRIVLECPAEELGEIIPGKTKVNLWYTRDGHRWYHTQTMTKKGPPYEIGVAKDGRYGFTLRAQDSGMPIAVPPAGGEEPQLWVEVDTVKPKVQLLQAQPSVGESAPVLAIQWKAADQHLGETPISLAYAHKANGPWIPIADQVANSGSLIWKIPSYVPSQILLRVQAVDKAGNVGGVQTTRPLSLPRARK